MLDPEARRLGENERGARAQVLLTRALGERDRCLGASYGGPVADSARSLLATVPTVATAEHTDATTELATSVWSTRPSRCVAGFVPDEVLATVLRSLEP